MSSRHWHAWINKQSNPQLHVTGEVKMNNPGYDVYFEESNQPNQDSKNLQLEIKVDNSHPKPQEIPTFKEGRFDKLVASSEDFTLVEIMENGKHVTDILVNTLE